MLWLYAVLLATLIGGLGKVVHRKVAKAEDVPSYSFLFTLVAGLSFVPLLFLEETVLPTGLGWITVLAAAFLWFIINITGFNAAKYTEVSLKAPLNNLKVLFLFVLAIVFLQEAVTVQKVAGTLLVFLGSVVLTWEKGSFRQLKEKGVQLTVLTAFLTAIVTMLDKYNITIGISRNFYGLAMYLVPCFLHGLRVTNRKHQMQRIIRNQGKTILFIGVIYGVIYYYLYLFAYSFKEAEISIIFPITQLGMLVALALGYVWLGEKTDLKKRIAASAVMIAGAILVTI
jgi:drug/metabolite transporter (DMT)-like permease